MEERQEDGMIDFDCDVSLDASGKRALHARLSRDHEVDDDEIIDSSFSTLVM
jgi:hypothetical protein